MPHINTWQRLSARDLLFRVGLYRGIAVPSVPALIICTLHSESPFRRVFDTCINEEHPLALWLFEECAGPWAIRMRRPLAYRKTYLAFARVADAVTFRLLSA